MIWFMQVLIHSFKKLRHIIFNGLKFLDRQTALAEKLQGYACRLLFHGFSLWRKRRHHFPFIFRQTFPGDQSCRLQSFEQGGQRSGIKVQKPSDVAYAQRFMFPQHQHHEVLRVGEADAGEQRAVAARDGARRPVQGEAELVLEGEAGGRRGIHGSDSSGRWGATWLRAT